MDRFLASAARTIPTWVKAKFAAAMGQLIRLKAMTDGPLNDEHGSFPPVREGASGAIAPRVNNDDPGLLEVVGVARGQCRLVFSAD